MYESTEITFYYIIILETVIHSIISGIIMSITNLIIEESIL